MIRFFGQMMLLPVTALATGIELFAQTVQGMQRTDKGSSPAERRGGTKSRSAGAHSCESMNDEQLKLVEYTIVSLQRGNEQIVDRGQTVVSERISTDAFASRLVDELSRKRRLESAESKQLRVYSQVLTRWPQRRDSGAG